MFVQWLRRLDYINGLWFIFGCLMLLIFRDRTMDGLILLAAAFTLLLSKYRPTQNFTWITYFLNMYVIGMMMENLMNFQRYDLSSFALILTGSLLIAFVAMSFRFGTGTLSFFWLIFHPLVIIQSFLAKGSFWDIVWSPPITEYVFAHFYPILIMFFLIGVFLDRFQTEVAKEYHFR